MRTWVQIRSSKPCGKFKAFVPALRRLSFSHCDNHLGARNTSFGVKATVHADVQVTITQRKGRLEATHNFLNFTSHQFGLANTGNYSSEDLWVERLMGLKYSTLNLLGEMISCVDPGVSVGDVAIVFDEGMVTSTKYASWIVMNVRPQPSG
jgi:hypothetical protein